MLLLGLSDVMEHTLWLYSTFLPQSTNICLLNEAYNLSWYHFCHAVLHRDNSFCAALRCFSSFAFLAVLTRNIFLSLTTLRIVHCFGE